MKCPNCGNENPPDYVFCDECGARLQGGEDSAAMSQLSDTSDGGGMPVASQVHMDASGSGGAVGSQETEHASGGGYSASGASAYMGTSPEAPTLQHSPEQHNSAASEGYDASSGSGNQIDLIGADSTTSSTGMDSAGSVSRGAEGSDMLGVQQMAGAGAGNGQAEQAAFDEPGSSGSLISTSDETASAVGSAAGQSATHEGGNMEMAATTEGALQGFDAGLGGQQQDGTSQSQDEYQGIGQEAAMPGVTQIDEQDQVSMQPGLAYAPAIPDDTIEGDVAASPMVAGGAYADVVPSTGVGTMSGQSGQGEWASEALRRLDRAQQALRADDWILFGQGMADLRSYLMSVGATTTVSDTATSASSQDSVVAQPAYISAGSDYSSETQGVQAGTTGSSPQNMPYSDSSEAQASPYSADANAQDQGYTATPASQPSDSPMLEPAAEAGTLPADVGAGTDADANYGVDFGSQEDGGYTGADQSSAIDTGAGDSAADASVAAISGSTTASTAPSTPSASSGMGMSNNGAVENMLARLVIISTGAELPLPDQEEITVGREDPSSGIFPDVDLTPYGGEEGGVSRRHARMLFVNDEYFVEDLQSTNFTKLDGQRLPAHVRERLEDGARIDFGRVATIFRRS